MLIINLAPGQVSIRHGAKGPNLSTVSACASGTHSIGDAYRMIERGDADAMIAGGTESTITPLGIGGFNVMRALSTRNDDPQEPVARLIKIVMVSLWLKVPGWLFSKRWNPQSNVVHEFTPRFVVTD